MGIGYLVMPASVVHAAQSDKHVSTIIYVLSTLDLQVQRKMLECQHSVTLQKFFVDNKARACCQVLSDVSF